MKSSYLSIGLISIATLSVLSALPVPPASAQCVMNDTNIQLSMNGSRKASDRSNTLSQDSNGNCVGNSISTTNVQVSTGGTDRSRQHRQSTQQINSNNSSTTGINMNPVKLHQNVQIDVDNPADRL